MRLRLPALVYLVLCRFSGNQVLHRHLLSLNVIQKTCEIVYMNHSGSVLEPWIVLRNLSFSSLQGLFFVRKVYIWPRHYIQCQWLVPRP